MSPITLLVCQRLLRALAQTLLLFSILFVASVCVANDPAGLEFFEKQVRPILVTHCESCHGAEKQESGLRVDSLQSLIKGGEYGPAIVPGNPKESLLISAVNHGEIIQMPPKTKLKGQQIEDLTKWVQMGAHWPDATPASITQKADGPKELFSADDKSFWAFRPPQVPSIPDVVNAKWCQSPLDRFLLSRLEEKQIAPAPSSPRHILIRRATLDLLGITPSPEEVDAFLQDSSPDAWERVVDRLLASPLYGQRWARHWLDLARYADSNGMDENVAHANAFRYRDYVVQALNTDKPYDQFVQEQIAGDLLAEPTNTQLTAERLTATGFLVIGPKMLAEDDPRKMEMDIIDEQLDTVGKTFMGMTLGCARCHDHKFDPIPTADYYSLAAIFKSTKTMENFHVVAMWNERTIATPQQTEEHEKAKSIATEKRSQLESATKQAKESLLTEAKNQANKYLETAINHLRAKTQAPKSYMTEMPPPSDALVLEAEKFTRGNVVRDFTTYGQEIGVVYNAGEIPNFIEFDLTIAQGGIYQIELRFAAADPRPVRISIDGKPLKEQAAEKATGSWNPDSQTWQAECLIDLKAGEHVLRIDRAGPFPHLDKVAIVPAASIEGERVPPVFATLEGAAENQQLNLPLLKSWVSYLEKKGLDQTPPLADILADAMGPLNLPADITPFLATDIAKDIKGKKESLQAAEKGIPPLPMVMSASEGKAGNLRVHLRGNYLTLDKEVPRQFLQIIAGSNQTAIDDKRSGRLELAKWMTKSDHPLTSRVIANRVWHWHFGNGIVRSPDNFGRLGEKPDHPELLDWLATRLSGQSWSLKKLHRLIMLSSIYQMSATYNSDAFSEDPENRLYWRKDRRRMEAETLRDSILAISGELDTSFGGTLLTIGNHAYVTSTASDKFSPYHVRRRSVYLPIARSSVYDFFQAFDFADPSTPNGQRATTTIAPQALALMNSRLVEEQSEKWAEKLIQAVPNTSDRLQLAYRQAYGRPPTESEVNRGLQFLNQVTSALPSDSKINPEIKSWQSLCRVLIASSEFVYAE